MRRVAAGACVPILAGALAFAAPFARAYDIAAPPPVSFTAEQDHANMMQQLGIEALRPGASGDENDPDHANYDELLANPYPSLSDPLTRDDGGKVTSAAVWWQKRRPEIAAALEDDVYGHIPENVPGVTWRVVARASGTLGGSPILYKRLLGHVDNAAYPAIGVDIPVTLVLPAAAQGRVPVLIMFWFGPTPVPSTEPDDRELGAINGALRTALARSDPALSAVFRRQRPALDRGADWRRVGVRRTGSNPGASRQRGGTHSRHHRAHQQRTAPPGDRMTAVTRTHPT